MKLKFAKLAYVALVLSGLFIGPYSVFGACNPALKWHILPSHIFWLPTWPPIPIIVP